MMYSLQTHPSRLCRDLRALAPGGMGQEKGERSGWFCFVAFLYYLRILVFCFRAVLLLSMSFILNEL